MQLPIPTDWDGESTCRWAVCWPDSPMWKAILHGLIEMPMQGRLWDFNTGNFRDLRETFRSVYDYNFQLREVIMACGDSGISEALLAIASALQAQADATNNANAQAAATAQITANACCEQSAINSGGGVIGKIDNGDGTNTPIYGTQPPLSIAPGTFPDGFDSEEEYLLDKCQVSNLIIDSLINTIKTLGALTGAETGAALAILIIASVTASIIFPPAAVGIVAVALGVGGAIFSILLLVANYIQEHREDWVCQLYNGQSVEEIVTGISTLIEAMITALTIVAPFGVAVKTIILTMLNSDTLNALFELKAHFSYPDADCSQCNQEVTTWAACLEELRQTFIMEDLVGIAGCGTFNPSVYGVYLRIGVEDAGGVYPFTADNTTYTIDFDVTSGSLTNPFPTTGYNTYYYIDKAGSTLYQGNVEQPALGVRIFQLFSITPFTVTITVTPEE